MKKLNLSLLIFGMFLLLNCKKNKNPIPAPQPFKFNFESASVAVGEVKMITAADVSTEYPFSEISFKSADESVVVNWGGTMVKGIAKGTAEIKAYRQGAEIGKFKLIVNYVPVSAMSLADVSLRETEESGISLKFSPENTTNQLFTWTSSDPTVATIINTGYVAKMTAIRPGVTTITATSPDGLTASCKLTVVALPPFPKAGIDAFIKSFNEQILPVYDKLAESILTKLTLGYSSKGMIVNNRVGTMIISKSVYNGSSFFETPIPTTPIGGFSYFFNSQTTTQMPPKSYGSRIAVTLGETSFEITTVENVKKSFNYNQVSEATTYILGKIQEDLDRIKAQFPGSL